MKAFQYLIIHHPTDKKQKSKIIAPLDTILAKDQASALLLVAREIPEIYLSDLSEIEVAIRPF